MISEIIFIKSLINFAFIYLKGVLLIVCVYDDDYQMIEKKMIDYKVKVFS